MRRDNAGVDAVVEPMATAKCAEQKGVARYTAYLRTEILKNSD